MSWGWNSDGRVIGIPFFSASASARRSSPQGRWTRRHCSMYPPDGGSDEKPIGLTYVAAALRDGSATVERHVWPHDRDGNKRASALAALELARRLASESPA